MSDTRNLFAAAALQGLLANPARANVVIADIAEDAFDLADAMMNHTDEAKADRKALAMGREFARKAGAT